MTLFIIFGSLIVLIGLVFALKPGKVSEKDRADPNKIKFHFSHWIPRLLRSDGVTIGYHVFFRHTQAELYPWNSRSLLQFLRHEFRHIEQYEDRGIIDYVIGHVSNSFGKFLKYWNFQKAYWNNDMEVDARGHANDPFTDKQMAVLLRYWPKGNA